MASRMTSYLIIPNKNEDSNIEFIYQQIRILLSFHLKNCLIIFPTISEIFHFMRLIPDGKEKDLIKDWYNKNNVLTQKSDFISEKINKYRNVLVIDHLGTETAFLSSLTGFVKEEQNLISFVMNPYILLEKDIIFPYGFIVNSIVNDNATDDELFIYLQLIHNITDKTLAKHHIDNIRKHLSGFKDSTFKTISDLRNFMGDIKL